MIYLRTRADTAVQRAAPAGTRPLLIAGDPVEGMRQLLNEREAVYLQADAKVDTDRQTAAEVATEVVRLAESAAGW